MNEEYKKINHPELNNTTFEISNFGNIKNIKTGNIRSINKLGRFQIDKSTHYSVGRLVALTFLSEQYIDYTKRKVTHIDKNKKNNRIDNLKWNN